MYVHRRPHLSTKFDADAVALAVCMVHCYDVFGCCCNAPPVVQYLSLKGSAGAQSHPRLSTRGPIFFAAALHRKCLVVVCRLSRKAHSNCVFPALPLLLLAGCFCLPSVHQVDFGEDVCIFGENLFISLTNEIERVSACLIRSQQRV